MVQRKKDEVYYAILEKAKEEFIEQGFQKASLRNIAREAGITHSNIYHYFGNKDALFRAVLIAVLNYLELGKAFLIAHEENHADFTLEDHMQIIDKTSEYLDANRELLKLLFFKANGSSLANIKNEIIDWFTDTYRLTLRKLSEKYNLGAVCVSDFFIHNISSIWMNFLMESLMHDLSLEEMCRDGRNMMNFIYYGWGGVLSLDCK
ncbi:MAG: TetR/AcrR family transcriptional regulator [Candidatus Cloacimonetes bacterium]|nr:TetR/AcrR family transcriptional regulator [Candidatus Cloacimonadota bacterium]